FFATTLPVFVVIFHQSPLILVWLLLKRKYNILVLSIHFGLVADGLSYRSSHLLFFFLYTLSPK
ncbi:hypothetical protein, partial [Listeria immobilis]|uniref:hypothetical protein n=1 Tax=Listeria immobilis TaxID=2713502 RepID=UPI001C898FF5